MAAVGVLLLISCTNIAGLLSSRAIERRHETAVRLSLGAPRGRLIRQALIESAVLGVIGGSFGLLFADRTITLLTRLLYNGVPMAALDIGLEPAVLLATLGVSLFASLLFGVLPAWQSSTSRPLRDLREGGFFAGTRRFRPLRHLLVIVQVALSLILLYGAALFYRTLRNLQTVDLGFELERVALLSARLESRGYSPSAVRSLFDRLLAEARRIPGVEAAGLSLVSPLSGGSMMGQETNVPGFTGYRDHLDYVQIVSPGYFAALGMPILRGRAFEERDRMGSPCVVVVNQSLASFYWARGNPIGKTIQSDTLCEVVGLVGNANYRRVRETAPPTIYFSVAQTPPASWGRGMGMTLVARARGNPSSVLGDLRQAALALGIPIDDLRTLETQRDYTISTERTMAFLSGIFAVLAAVIAMAGLTGVIAFGVSTRTNEIGVRCVLGANRIGVAWLFLRETLLLTGAGVVTGIPLAMSASRVLERFVFGLPSWHPQTVAIVAGLVMATGTVAVLAPLRRAVTIEPAVALRAD